jgi:hypothetical protein
MTQRTMGLLCTTPRYWMQETSGILEPVIVAYLHREPMDEMQVSILRAYLRQWIDATVWNDNPFADGNDQAAIEELRESVKYLATRDDIEAWLRRALVSGIDPI